MNLRDQLIRDEGKRNYTYADSLGYHTWGIGHLDKHSPIGEYHTDDQVYAQFDADVQVATQALEKALPWVSQLDQVRRDCLINMSFNLGVATLCTFHIKLQAIHDQKWDEAAADMLQSKWARQVGNRAIRLAAQMRTGEYQ